MRRQSTENQSLSHWQAESKGMELELVTLLTDNFTVAAAAGYTDAEFKDTIDSEDGNAYDVDIDGNLGLMNLLKVVILAI